MAVVLSTGHFFVRGIPPSSATHHKVHAMVRLALPGEWTGSSECLWARFSGAPQVLLSGKQPATVPGHFYLTGGFFTAHVLSPHQRRTPAAGGPLTGAGSHGTEPGVLMGLRSWDRPAPRVLTMPWGTQHSPFHSAHLHEPSGARIDPCDGPSPDRHQQPVPARMPADEFCPFLDLPFCAALSHPLEQDPAHTHPLSRADRCERPAWQGGAEPARGGRRCIAIDRDHPREQEGVHVSVGFHEASGRVGHDCAPCAVHEPCHPRRRRRRASGSPIPIRGRTRATFLS